MVKKNLVPVLISNTIYYFILNGLKESYSTKEISESTNIVYRKASCKLHKLKQQGFLVKNVDGTWSIGIR